MKKKFRYPRCVHDARVFIGLPLSGPLVYWCVVGGIIGLEKPFKSVLSVTQIGFVDHARNELVRKMMDHSLKPSHIFFVDSDIVLPPDTLVRLLGRNVPIISGLYRGRYSPHGPIAYERMRNGRYQPIRLHRHRFRTVDAVGAGCLLIQREVFRQVEYPWFVSRVSRDGLYTEDFYFCEEAIKAGYKIHLDPGVHPLHVELMGVGEDKNRTGKIVPIENRGRKTGDRKTGDSIPNSD